MALQALVRLDGTELTDQGRTISINRDERSVEFELADGTIKKYIKSVKKIWDIDWEWLPGDSSNTYDSKEARDFILGKAITGNSYTLIIQAQGGDETYNVFIDNYDEKVLRRDATLSETFYNVSVSLREI